MLLRIEYLYLTGKHKVTGGHRCRTLNRKRDGLWLVGEELEADLADVEQDSDDVFLDTFYSRKFVRNARNLHVRDCSSRK